MTIYLTCTSRNFLTYLLIDDVHHLQIVKLKFLTFRLTGSSGVTLITLGVDAHNLANTQH